MHILCCLDGTNAAEIAKAVALLASGESLMYGLLYVTDTEPRREIERTRERFLRAPSGPLAPRHDQMRQVEQAAAQDILDEGLSLLPGAEVLQRQGRPEREIAQSLQTEVNHLPLESKNLLSFFGIRSLHSLQHMLNILADVVHHLGQPIFRAGIIGGGLDLVVLVAGFLLVLLVDAAMALD
jgi:hypothetical protein